MKGMEININCDLGEKSELHSIENDPELLKIVNSASIACGYHAGDEETMHSTIKISKQNGVSIGAHPSFKDLENFGRRRINLSEKDIINLILYMYLTTLNQVGWVSRFCCQKDLKIKKVNL